MTFNSRDKKFYKNFFILALPMAFQSMLTTSVNLIDNIMIGQLGDVSIAAVGLANKIFFIYSLMIFGICGGASAFIAQYWGKRDYKGIKSSFFINITVSVIISILFFIFAFSLPEWLMSLLSDDPAVILEGAGYLKIISLGFIFTGITLVNSFALKNTEHPTIPLIGSVISIVVNTALNYILIFGKLGAPTLGANGAAVATVTARVVEFVFVTSLTFKKLDFLTKNLKDYLDIPKSFIKSFFVTALPVTINETLWSIGTTVIAAIYARVSTVAIASVNIVNIMYDLSSVFLFGASHATGITVGKEIGLKKYDTAYTYANRLSVVVPLVSCILSIILVFICPYFLQLFNISDDVKNLTLTLYIIMAVYTPIRAFNHVNIVGSLRYGGDTMFCLISDSLCIWIIGVIGAYLTGIEFGLSMVPVYIISQAEEAVKGVLIFLRMRKKNWIKDLVN